jgi:hypothetical protein
MDLRIGGKYRLTKKLGEGAFGVTMGGVNVKTNEEVAIKLEKRFEQGEKPSEKIALRNP